MKHKGFTLIELMIYVTLVCLLMYWLTAWSITMMCRNNALHSTNNHAIDCSIVHDIFVKDMFSASCQKSTWMTVAPDLLVYKKEDGTYVEWCYKNNNLYRATGIYNPLNAAWSKKHTDLLLTHGAIALFSVTEQQMHINTATLAITAHDQHYFFTGAMRHAYS